MYNFSQTNDNLMFFVLGIKFISKLNVKSKNNFEALLNNICPVNKYTKKKCMFVQIFV